MRVKLSSSLHLATLSLLFVGMSASGAHAYLDAGTGSMILQVLLGGIAGLLIAGKLYWYRFLSLVGIRREQGQAGEGEDERKARPQIRPDR
ncbi:hypothetical protein [Nitratireductor sp. GCM10026969]|uniref:hypothetical protein n=1 Tax=Nitratireductor sp. GCM10026969 TaxID=3252645 RepID=UPI00360EA42A